MPPRKLIGFGSLKGKISNITIGFLRDVMTAKDVTKVQVESIISVDKLLVACQEISV